jgi:hypothetical protein
LETAPRTEGAVDPLVVTTKTLLDIMGNLRLRGVKSIVIDLERNQVDYKR